MPLRTHPLVPDKRLDLFEEGAIALQVWLTDLLGTGMMMMPTLPNSFFNDFAAYLVDLKMGSLARRIRKINELRNQDPYPEKALLKQIEQLILINESYRQQEQLSDDLYIDVLVQSGFNLTKRQLEPLPSRHTTWTVIGQSFGQEEQLTIRKSWVLLHDTNKIALILDFKVGQQAFATELAQGHHYSSLVTYYPSALPLRIYSQTIEPQALQSHALKPKILDDFQALHQLYIQSVGQQPWLYSIPVIIQNISYRDINKAHYLIDNAGRWLSIGLTYTEKERLALISGFYPFTGLFEYNGQDIRLLSIINHSCPMPISTRQL